MRFSLPSQWVVMQSLRQRTATAISVSRSDLLHSSHASRSSRKTSSSLRCLQNHQTCTWRRTLCSQRSSHSARRSAPLYGKKVDTWGVVTRSAVLDSPIFADSDIWHWRKAQLQKIAMFTGPALSIPLADPIMSLVDTVCIGQVC